MAASSRRGRVPSSGRRRATWGRDGYTQALALFDHSSCTVDPATFLVFHAHRSPISALPESSYQPRPGTASVIASHSSCELVDVKASRGLGPPVPPPQPGYGMTA